MGIITVTRPDGTKVITTEKAEAKKRELGIPTYSSGSSGGSGGSNSTSKESKSNSGAVFDTSKLTGYAKYFAEAINQGLSAEEANIYATIMNGGSGLSKSEMDRITSNPASKSKSSDYSYDSSGNVINEYHKKAQDLLSQLLQPEYIMPQEFMFNPYLYQNQNQFNLTDFLSGIINVNNSLLSGFNNTFNKFTDKLGQIGIGRGLYDNMNTLPANNLMVNKNSPDAVVRKNKYDSINRFLSQDIWKNRYMGY